MQYKVDDIVLFSADVCKITDIEEKEMSGNKGLYYILKPIYDDKTVIYIPVDNERATSQLRDILPSEDVYALIESFPEEDTIWIDDDNTRRERYRDIIAGGDRSGMVRIIKTLHLFQKEQKEKGKKLHVADERFMKDAEKRLYDEFAFVLNMDPEQVPPFINARIGSKIETPL